MALPSRLSGTLPVSVAVHLGVLVLVLVIPLAANVALPIPDESIDRYIPAVPAPLPPPAPAMPVPRSTPPPVARDAAPVEAPVRIIPEIPRAPADDRVTDPGGIPFGTPGGLSSVLPMTGELPVQPPPLPIGPVRAAELVRAPIKIVDARPVYPALARDARVEGTVILEAVLDRAGHVSRLHVIRSVPLLDDAALDAVRRWQYTPSTLHGAPVEVLMTITVTFSLQR